MRRLLELACKKSDAFSIVEVIISVSIFFFVGSILINAISNSKNLASKSSNRIEFYNDVSLAMLYNLNNNKDKLRLINHISKIALKDNAKNYLKTKTIFYEKDITSKEPPLLLNTTLFRNHNQSIRLYGFEIGN